jgi:hypothetical protein
MKVLHVETGRHLYGGALQVRFLLEGLVAGWPDDEHVLVCPVGAATVSYTHLTLPTTPYV